MNGSPQGFKGIALFTPGGDLVYCIDPQKQTRWHVHLCDVLQHVLGLVEPPHFLVPCYTATVDRSVDPTTQRLTEIAEASALVMRYQSLLNLVFDTEGLIWQATPRYQEICDPIVLSTYRSQFPQLWESHDLVLRYDQAVNVEQPVISSTTNRPYSAEPSLMEQKEGYVLRLYVSGHSMSTEHVLKKLHQLLEQLLTHPYTLKVIDVAQHPELAEQDHVTATPTLVRVYPLPTRRIVGNLNKVDQLLGVLRTPDL